MGTGIGCLKMGEMFRRLKWESEGARDGSGGLDMVERTEEARRMRETVCEARVMVVDFWLSRGFLVRGGKLLVRRCGSLRSQEQSGRARPLAE